MLETTGVEESELPSERPAGLLGPRVAIPVRPAVMSVAVEVPPGRLTSAELAELFSVARSTVYRAVSRAGGPAPAPPRS